MAPMAGQEGVRLFTGLNLVHLGTEECLKANPMMNGIHKVGCSWSTSKRALNSSLYKRSQRNVSQLRLSSFQIVFGVHSWGSGGGF